jgi:hypothetical protein
MRRRTRKSVRWHDDEHDDEIRREPSPPITVPPSTILAAQPELPRPATEPMARTAKPRRRRPRRALSLFYAALAVSALFHLSMVTIFNVVIYFPRQDLDYFNVRIVQTRPAVPLRIAARDQLRAPTLDDVFRRDSGLDEGAELGTRLPSIELPTLEFAELSRLKVRQQNLDAASDYSELFDDTPRDSWAQFGAGIKRLRRTLTGLAFPAADMPPDESPAESAAIFQPGPGYEAYIEWDSEPKSRKLLFSPPIEALWRADPASLKRAIQIVLKVDTQGRVVNVWSPAVDQTGLVDAVQMSVLKYRFEPLGLDGQGEQVATLHIQAAGNPQ